MKNLLKRTLSGICFLAIVLTALLVSKYLFGVIVVIAMALMMREFYRMTMRGEYVFSQVLSILAGVVMFSLTFLYRGFDFPGSASCQYRLIWARQPQRMTSFSLL